MVNGGGGVEGNHPGQSHGRKALRHRTSEDGCRSDRQIEPEGVGKKSVNSGAKTGLPSSSDVGALRLDRGAPGRSENTQRRAALAFSESIKKSGPKQVKRRRIRHSLWSAHLGGGSHKAGGPGQGATTDAGVF